MKTITPFVLIAMCALACHGAEKLSYNRDVRPILSDTCFKCHGPDKSNVKGKLRLDIGELALKKEAFIPGKPQESELIKRIRTKDEDDVMPPPDAPRQLSEAQKKILEQWIAEGAQYEPHWAYIPPVKTPVPQVSDKKWGAQPIDAFILQKLDDKKITPSPIADRATLLRRITLDLIGLPPTEKELADFLADKSELAYEKVVDRLMASPHFGERMAVPWLDAVRFSDTVGFHGDQNQNNFPYRDWVINAINTNMPFDRFTAEQLAGDLLPDATTSSKVASGFNRLNMMTREGGAQPDEYMAKYAADRVRTLGGAWLGSTLACCECHDHKYDPWSTKDFYQFASFFADIRQWGVYADYGYTRNPDLKGFNNDYPFPPEIEVDSPYLINRIDRLRKQGEALAGTAIKKDDAGFAEWRKSVAAFTASHPDGWAAVKPTAPAAKAPYSLGKNGTLNITAKRDSNVILPLSVEAGWIAAIRITLAQENKGSALLSDKGKGNPNVSIKLQHLAKGEKKSATIGYRIGDASDKVERYRSGSSILGISGGWNFSDEIAKTPATAIFILDRPINIGAEDSVELVLEKNDLYSFHIAVSPFVPTDLKKGTINADFVNSLKNSSAPKSDALVYAYALGTAVNSDLYNQLTAIDKTIEACRNGKAMTTVAEAWQPKEVRVLPRGNWQDTSGEVVSPEAPEFLNDFPTKKSARRTRLDLATWLTSADNPLTARVFVNRLWAQLMGVGLCATVDDFGLQGEWPSHPELLDWLAVDFREHKWDVKRMVKQIVMSNTYCQSAVQRTDILAHDPANRLRAMQSPRRLDAEFIRDNALFISGLLTSYIGGPSVKPYQPPGYYANLQFPNRDYVSDTDDEQYRRGLYMHWQRTFLHPMLANFDAPSRDECAVFRTQANSPQQALTLLNDPTFVEAARAWAAKIVDTKGTDEQRIRNAFKVALCRSPSAEELQPLLKFLAKQRQHFSMQKEAADALLRTGLAPLPPEDKRVEVAAWAQLCRVILNLHETITRL